MAQIEKLLTLGLARSPSLEPMAGGGGVGGQASRRITGQDVCAAVAILPYAQRAALQIKAVPELVLPYEREALHDHLLRLVHRRPSPPGIHRAIALVETAVSEYADARICPPCRGKGKELVHVEGKGVVERTCPACAGNGWRPWSDNRRARCVHVRRSRWRALVDPYEAALRECSTLYRAAAATFMHQLFGEGDPEDPAAGAIERRLQAKV